jgi:hypothetical protein
MNFFIPSAKDRDQAEIVWSVVRKGLADHGLATTPRRIRALAWAGDGETHSIAVGADPPWVECDPVLAIFEASDFDVYYVCTFGQVARERLPRVFGLDDSWSVVDFE